MLRVTTPQSRYDKRFNSDWLIQYKNSKFSFLHHFFHCHISIVVVFYHVCLLEYLHSKEYDPKGSGKLWPNEIPIALEYTMCLLKLKMDSKRYCILSLKLMQIHCLIYLKSIQDNLMIYTCNNKMMYFISENSQWRHQERTDYTHYMRPLPRLHLMQVQTLTNMMLLLLTKL